MKSKKYYYAYIITKEKTVIAIRSEYLCEVVFEKHRMKSNLDATAVGNTRKKMTETEFCQEVVKRGLSILAIRNKAKVELG